MVVLFSLFVFAPTFAFWGQAPSCPMSSPSNSRPINQIQGFETLRLSRLPQRDLTESFSINGHCTPQSIHTASRASCQICFDNPVRGQNINHQIQGDLQLGKIQFDERTFQCGGKKPEDYRAADLKPKEEILRSIERLRTIQHPGKSPVHFQSNGEPYSTGLVDGRNELLNKYRSCLKRGAVGRFGANPFDCLNWLREHGRRSLYKFEFLETDDFFSNDPKRFKKNFGYFTREILKMSCRVPSYNRYTIAVEGSNPKLEVRCRDQQGIWEGAPSHRFAMFFKNQTVSTELSFFRTCEALEQAPAESSVPASN